MCSGTPEGSAPASLQLYVDDPVVTLAGPRLAQGRSVDLLLTWWLVLGIPLSWEKGVMANAYSKHTWIGVEFRVLQPGCARMTVPRKFLNDLLSLLQSFIEAPHAPFRDAQRLVGRVGRIAHVVPEARPFAAALYAALAESQRAAAANAREAPPGRVACRRFKHAAKWVRVLVLSLVSACWPRALVFRPCVWMFLCGTMFQIAFDSEGCVPVACWAAAKVLGEDNAPFSLHRDVRLVEQVAYPNKWRVEFDASPWGGGAVLFVDDMPREYFAVVWKNEDAAHLRVHTGVSKFQTFWAFLTLLLCLILWAESSKCLAVLGDNTAALQSALALKGAGPLLAIARELAWRKARRQWCFEVGHLASEANVLADALSRLAMPEPAAFPEKGLAHARRRSAPNVRSLWKII